MTVTRSLRLATLCLLPLLATAGETVVIEGDGETALEEALARVGVDLVLLGGGLDRAVPVAWRMRPVEAREAVDALAESWGLAVTWVRPAGRWPGAILWDRQGDELLAAWRREAAAGGADGRETLWRAIAMRDLRCLPALIDAAGGGDATTARWSRVALRRMGWRGVLAVHPEAIALCRADLADPVASDVWTRWWAWRDYAAHAGAEAVPDLAAQLEQVDTYGRSQVAVNLGYTRSPEALPALGKLAADPHHGIRRGAAEGLGILGLREGLDLLDTLTGDPDLEVVKAAAAALGRIDDPRSVARLQTLLGDPHPEVRAAALASLDRREDLPWSYLEAVLDRELDPVRQSALACIGRRPGRRAVDLIVRTIARADGPEAWKAIYALMGRGDPEAGQALRCLAGLEGEAGALISPGHRSWIAARLEHRHVTGNECYGKPIAEWSDEELMERGWNLTGPDRLVAIDRIACRWAANRGDHEALAFLARQGIVPTVPDWSRLLAGMKVEMYTYRLEDLAWHGGPAAVPLLQHLAGHHREDVRIQALTCLLDLGGPEAAWVHAALARKENERVRNELRPRLGSIGVGQTHSRVPEDDDPHPREVVDGLTLVAAKPSLESVMQAYAKAEAAQRVEILGRVDELFRTERPTLVRAAIADPDPDLRVLAIPLACQHLPAGEVVEHLGRLAFEPDEQVRREAVRHLAEVWDPSATAIWDRLARERGPATRMERLRALMGLGDPRALDLLEESLDGNSSEAIRAGIEVLRYARMAWRFGGLSQGVDPAIRARQEVLIRRLAGHDRSEVRRDFLRLGLARGVYTDDDLDALLDAWLQEEDDSIRQILKGYLLERSSEHPEVARVLDKGDQGEL